VSTVVSIVALSLAAVLFPSSFSLFRANGVLAGFEQEHLVLARSLAQGHGLSIDVSGLNPLYGGDHRALFDGRLVPRGTVLPYLIYAVPFLVSDTAWIVVTPAFAVLAVLAAGLIVESRTGSLAAAGGACLALFAASPFFLAASGIAYENMIALAFLLWGIYWTDRFTQRPRVATAAAAGLMFAAVAMTRADYAPALLLFAGFLGGWCALRWWRSDPRRNTALLGSIVGITIGASGIAVDLATNYLVTGDPLHTAYGPSAWQGSVSGVASNLEVFSLDDFVRQARYFLWDIGRPSTLLLGVGIAGIAVRRGLTGGELILFGLGGFLIYFDLGRPGLHATDAAVLMSSPPRYLLPVYATGIVVGFSALPSCLPRKLSVLPLVTPTILMSVALVASVRGLQEAYEPTYGIPRVERIVTRSRIAHDFSKTQPDALFVGDLDTRGIIVTQRILAPRLAGDLEQVTAAVRNEIASGRRVFVVDDPRQLVGHPDYSGYREAIQGAGMFICRGKDLALPSEVIGDIPGAARLIASLTIPTDGASVLTPALTRDTLYYFGVSGTFTYNAAGAKSDGVDLAVDRRRTAPVPSPDHLYCKSYIGTGEPAVVGVFDQSRSDNVGSLNVVIYRAD